MKEQRRLHNRRKQILAHTGDPRALQGRGKKWKKNVDTKLAEEKFATHKKTNGAFVNDEAREISEKIQAYESTTPSQSKEISSSDSLAHVLGSQEHNERVRGLGLGPYPSKVFGIHARSHSGSSSSTPSNAELQSQVSSLTSNVQLQSEVSSLTSQVSEMKAMMTLLLQNNQGSLQTMDVMKKKIRYCYSISLSQSKRFYLRWIATVNVMLAIV